MILIRIWENFRVEKQKANRKMFIAVVSQEFRSWIRARQHIQPRLHIFDVVQVHHTLALVLWAQFLQLKTSPKDLWRKNKNPWQWPWKAWRWRKIKNAQNIFFLTEISIPNQATFLIYISKPSENFFDSFSASTLPPSGNICLAWWARERSCCVHSLNTFLVHFQCASESTYTPAQAYRR